MPLANLAKDEAGKTVIDLHLHPGQEKAMASEKRIVLVLSGVRSGKTSLLPFFLHREMQRRGPGDYLLVAPSYKLLDQAAGPEMETVLGRMLGLGRVTNSPRYQFTVSPDGERRLWPQGERGPTRIIFGHADDPMSLAAMTVKAAVCDEADQPLFREDSWNEVQTRTAIHQGRILLATTVYNIGWLKRLVYDPWKRDRDAGRDHPTIDVINFPSTANPAFPREEAARAERELPRWKYLMRFEGRFERPAGAIYDCFDTVVGGRHVWPPFKLQSHWRRFAGIDFGPKHMAAVGIAEECEGDTRKATGRYIIYKEYPKHGWQSASFEDHVAGIRAGEPTTPMCYGGNQHGEEGWREAFRQHGLPIREPLTGSVEAGIARVYSLLVKNQLLITTDCPRTIDQLANYSYELGPDDEPLPGKIADQRAGHFCDAVRYIAVALGRNDGGNVIKSIIPDAPRDNDRLMRKWGW